MPKVTRSQVTAAGGGASHQRLGVAELASAGVRVKKAGDAGLLALSMLRVSQKFAPTAMAPVTVAAPTGMVFGPALTVAVENAAPTAVGHRGMAAGTCPGS